MVPSVPSTRQTPGSTNWLKIVIVTVAVVVVALITWRVVSALTPEESADSGTGTSVAAGRSASVSATPHSNPESFNGPIIEHCGARSNTTTLSKLNIDTGEVVDLASFPLPCWTIGDFRGQQERMRYSPDFHKALLERQSGEDIIYYDSDTHETVDVTNIVSPPSTGDFGNNERPVYLGEQFDDQGMIVFFDNGAEEFNFFDTKLKKVTRTSKTYLAHFQQVTFADPDQESLEPFEPSKKAPAYRTCSGLWLIDDNRYLRAVQDGSGNYIEIASIPKGIDWGPKGIDGGPDCKAVAGQRVTPSANDFAGAVADPTGTTILFLVYSRTNLRALNMYRANLENPSNPTQVTIAGDLLENAGVVNPSRVEDSVIVNILGWK
jgi:hypothetical protein